jgi:hypothetical protein
LQELDDADFKKILTTPEGARVIAGLLDFCRVFAVSHEHGRASPLDTAFYEGHRNVGLMLLRRIQDVEGGEQFLAQARKRRREAAEECERHMRGDDESYER